MEEIEKRNIIYPKIGTHFKLTVNLNGGRQTFGSGIVYIISGFGCGRRDENGKRRQFWSVLDKFNTQIPEKTIWKDDLNRLFDEKKIIEISNTVEL